MSRTGRTAGPRSQEWVRLQRKIFSRWVKQKLLRTRPEMQINDIVDDYKDGLVLMNLIEVLSESKFEGKYNQRPKMSVHRIDNLNNALKFAWSKGVDMKVKPSAEQLEKGDQKAALALTWGIMMKFIKIDDGSGGEALNAKDALLMWCKNKTAGYKGVEITDFKKSFADGLALCAIIHKHRPKLIDFNSLDSSDPIKTLQIAQDAAEKYFGLEKYITPDEIRKLDENSMVVYVSEYYYGIAEQRKLDLAARRIKKLIVLTKENDRLKAEYNKTANNFKATVKKVEKILEDRTIDNTMAGAKRRLDQFYEYKAKDKNSLIADQLDLESNYNNLAMRLSHHKRPEFKPEKGCSLKEVAQDMLHLEECEQERKVALHAELNRQIKLVNISKQHESRYNKLVDYFKQKKEYLEFREEIDSVSAAYFQISLLDRYEKENQTMINTGVAHLKKLSAELKQEKYEYQAKIEEHDHDIDDKFKELDKLAKIKRPILDDHLKREEFIEKVRQMNDEHKNKHEQLLKWFEIKKAYLKTMEEINSVPDASKNLDIFNSYVKEYKKYQEKNLVEFKNFGKETMKQKYQTEYSEYIFNETKYQGKTFGKNQFSDLTDRHDDMDQKFKELEEFAQQKKAILDDHFKREKFIEVVRQMNEEHKDKYEKLVKWFDSKKAYLDIKEEINTVPDASKNLDIFNSYVKEYKKYQEKNLVEFHKLGDDTLKQKYQTEFSEYVYDETKYQGKSFGKIKSEDITDRHDDMDKKFKELEEFAKQKKAILDDHLKREEFIEVVRQMNEEHKDKYEKLVKWFDSKKAYLDIKEEINSVSEARTQLNLFSIYSNEYKDYKQNDLVEFHKLGDDTLKQKYQTEFSEYVYDETKYQGKSFGKIKSEDITDRHDDMDKKFKDLEELAKQKKEILDDHLKREEFIVTVRRMNTEHQDQFKKLVKWFEDQKNYLNIREEINSVGEAQSKLSLFDVYLKEYIFYKENELVEFKKLGKDLLNQKYQTEFSEYVYDETKYQGKTFNGIKSKDITDRHDDMDKKFKDLEELAKQKKEILDDHLKREEFIVIVRRMNTEHQDQYKKLVEWFEVKKGYLEAREEINSVSEAKTRLNLFDVYLREYKESQDNELSELKKFGAETLNQKYQTEFSEYVYDETKYQGKTFGKIKSEDMTDRHDDMDKKFKELTEFSKSKKGYLDECLKLETKKEELRLAFANAVSEFTAFIKLEIENASLREFGFILEEVEAYRKVIDDSDKEVLHKADDKKTECQNVKKQLDEYKVVDNPYTSLTLEDLEKSLDSLKAALGERIKAYEIELKRQRDNDALCKKFAETADPFSKWITEQKDKITASKESLEVQLGFVDKLISGLGSESKRLDPLKDLQEKMDKAGIQNNRHTTLTLKDLEVQWQQYENFLKRKKKMLEEEIEHQKLRGITAEQMQEIEENFKQFDFDNSGTIDRKELMACLYSLGEERTPKEINKIMEEYGDGKDISYERFKDFMIVLFGDTDTKDEIINSFILINRGFKVAKKDLMELVMDDQDIEYVLKTAPQVDDGYDFHSWTEEMFAR
ncbi:alpha-actinin-2 [Anaeramoeba ignava]|uniref:Alpha-actinin-2 n=1 Tax=Anaeramoeba ignava TaxID=1746090 RepID=A0A9Q0LJ87_ANAIG|nr:alpha-actinin-2 [Anaeramoeba ignava]